MKNIIKFIYGFIHDCFIYRKHISVNQYFNFYKIKIIKRKGVTQDWKALKLRNYKHPFFYRPGSSDEFIVRDFFLRDNYAKTVPRAMRIIDAGANIGASSVLFKRRYPSAEVIAIEPDEENCELFKKNTAPYSDVELYKGGLTSTDGKFLKISDPDVPSYSFQLQYSDKGLPSYSISGLMDDKGWETLDIVKIDIEGGEKELFGKNIEWMNYTRQIIIELHDYKSDGCSKSLIGALQGKDFNISFSGENIILTNAVLNKT